MNQVKKRIIIVVVVAAVIIAFIFLLFNIQSKQWSDDENQRLSIIGNIEFKGKVINSKVYEYAGKNYYMVCVKLDTSNVKDFYVLNDLCALKIKNNVATMSASVFLDDRGPVNYIEENINHSGKEIFHYKDGPTEEGVINCDRDGLSEDDMNICN